MVKNKQLNKRIQLYCEQVLNPTLDKNKYLKIATIAPMALLATETALAQCNAATLTRTGGFYRIDVDNDGDSDFSVDDGYATQLWFTLDNTACSVAVDTGNGFNGYSSLFNSAAAPARLMSSQYLPIQNFVPRSALFPTYGGPPHGYGVLNHRGGVWPAAPMSGYVGIRCDYDNDGNYNYGFFFLDFDAAGIVTVDLSISGVDDVDDNLGIVGSCQSIGGFLPVELLNFDAHFKSESVVLNWATATEIDNMGFKVQRSNDGRNFKDIAWVDGHGTTIEEQQYTLEDKNLPEKSKVLYYRLVQMDFDGTTDKSDVVAVNINSDTDFLLSEFQPNLIQPGNNTNLIVDLLEHDNTIDIRVFNTNGQQFKAFSFQKASGKHAIVFETADLPSGIYYANININGITFHRKFSVQE